jgi:diguanylate cyclase (GGDEF)-like protein
MLLADVDHMKEANVLHGYIFGNKVLKTLADILVSSIRQEDVVARYGGDEFMILLPHTDFNGGQALRDRLQHRTAEALSAQRPEFNISITVGVCQYYIGETKETFIARADQALWQAKRGGDDDDELSVPVSV